MATTADRKLSVRSDAENIPPEKDTVMHTEFQHRGGMSPEDVEFLASFSDEQKKKAVRKVDLRLVPMLVLLYLMAYLDKTNIGNAKIEGLPKTLNMSNIDYNVAVSIFFIPFVLAEVPSNMILHMFKRPSLYMGGIVTVWGIFIIEGIATVVIGIMCFFLLVDSPALSKWLDADEKRFLELRQAARRVVRPDEFRDKHFDKHAFYSVVFDWKMWLLIFANWSNAVPNYAMKFTMPQIIKNMGYTSSDAQLMTIPPYAIGAVSAYVFSVFADRYSWRYPFLVAPQLSLIVAFSILFTKSGDINDNIGACYFAVCLACAGMYPILPAVNAWNVANCPSPQKRAISIGFLVCVGNIGGLIGSYIYLDREAPRYPTGFGTSFGFASAGIIAGTVLEFSLRRLNKKKELLDEDEVRRTYSDEELDKMGEKSPLFKYAL
ncbi:hypothetical protein ACHAPS_002452 [Verticillium nonalfalfae]